MLKASPQTRAAGLPAISGMRLLAVSLVACALALPPAPASAQAIQSGQTTETEAPPPAQAMPQPGTVRAPAGTAIQIETAEALSSERNRRGETFKLRLSRPIVVDGREIVAAGVEGTGEVVDAHRAGAGPGVLVVSARSLEIYGAQVPVSGNITLSGTNNWAVGFGDTGSIGTPVEIAMRTLMQGVLLSDLDAPAAHDGADTAAPPPAQTAAVSNQRRSARVTAPPPGQGQIVFFRPNRFVGAGGHFSIREGDVQIARLPNRSYTIVPIAPGIHEFTAVGVFGAARPTLRLEILPGETYYVEHSGLFLAPTTDFAFISEPLRLATSAPTQSRSRPTKCATHDRTCRRRPRTQ